MLKAGMYLFFWIMAWAIAIIIACVVIVVLYDYIEFKINYKKFKRGKM